MKRQTKNSPAARSFPPSAFRLPPLLGCVPYLNARPLIFGVETAVHFAVPSTLVVELRRGDLDGALIPVAGYFAHPRYRMVPGISIACRGPAQSVYLACSGPVEEIRTVVLDPASRTSNLLGRVILAEFYGLKPRYRKPAAVVGDRRCPVRSSATAHLLIGDPALRMRAQLRQRGFRLLDLGEAWWKATGLPFVFAVWALREGVRSGGWVDRLTNLKERGLRNIERIVQTQNVLPPAQARRYLTRHMDYRLGAPELRGIREFQRLAVKHGFLARSVKLRLVRIYHDVSRPHSGCSRDG